MRAGACLLSPAKAGEARLPSDDTETRRLAALGRYDIVGTPAEESFDRFARLAAHGLDMPIATVSFADASRHWLKAKVGTDLECMPRGTVFCEHTIGTDSPLVVPDAREDERFRDNPLVSGFPHIRFYAGAPIITPDGYRIGSMCVLSPEPRAEFDASSRKFLTELAQSVMTELELRRLNREQAKVSADLAFWNRLSEAIADAADFDAALDHALACCAERAGAAICFLVAFHPAYRMLEYVKSHIAQDSDLADFDMTPWFAGHPVDTISFGAALVEGRMYDSGPMMDADPGPAYPRLRELVRAGIRRQVVHPFDLADRRFGLVLDFRSPAIAEETHGLILEFVARLTPLLLGRLREDALERANRALRTIHEATEAFAHATTAQAVFDAACRLAVETGGYNTCWVGLAQHDPEKSVSLAASAGRGTGYVAQLRLSWADVPNGRGPAGTAIRERRISRWRDIAVDPRFEPWRHKALASGFRSCISLPFGGAGIPAAGALTLYSSDPMAFGEEERDLLVELTANMTKALQAFTTRQERDDALMAHSMSERRIDRLLAATGVVLYALALHGDEAVLVDMSENIVDMLGYVPGNIRGLDWWRNHVHPEDLPQAALGVPRTVESGQFVHRYRIRHQNGGYRWIHDEKTLQRDAAGNPVGIVGVWIDITERREAEEQIYRLAHIDPLTELPNRRLLNERLREVLIEARRTGVQGALLFIDLDRFKTINDMLGHSAGDSALRQAAQRLRQAVRAADTIARVGGDEFVVLIADAGSTVADAADHAATIARKMIDALTARPISIGEREYHLGASIGFTMFPKPDDTIDTLIREADTAMYQAKAGEADVVMFRQSMHLSIVARHAIEDEIRSALKAGRFEIWLQDQVELGGKPVGAEVLLRLRDRDGRIAVPSEFIGIAESSGLIVPLGRWLLREACALLARAHRDRPDWRLSVNVSPRQFRDPAFVTDVIAALDISGVPADRLTLEITENLLIRDTFEIARIMGILADRGVRFSVDDFGTGYSSLHYLRQLPIHEIKIDRGFIGQVPDDASSVAIVEAILAMARRLDLDVVAEGVETPEHVAFLKARGCPRMQGYFFACPIPVSEWLERSAHTPDAGVANARR